MVVEFFFQAAFGIAAGIACAVLPAFYVYHRFFKNGRGRV